MKLYKYILTSALFLVFVCSCGEYARVLKSTDIDEKYEYAQVYFNQGKYTRSITLLDDVVRMYGRGSEDAENALYLLAMSHFNMKDYLSSGEYFIRYCNTYPRGFKAMECRFNLAYGDYKDSPDARLDQDITHKAIKELDSFVESYPRSALADSATAMRYELVDKLCYKEYLSAKLYLNLGTYMGNNYEAAVITARNAQRDYPYTKYREDLGYIIFKARYEAAEYSVDEKKEDRLREAYDEYYTFSNEFPDGKYTKEVNKMFEKITKHLEKYEE